MSLYKIHIGGSEFEIPSEYTVDQWLNIQRFDVDNDMFWSRIISQACDMPLDEANKIPIETQQVAMGIIAMCLVPKGDVKIVVDRHSLIDLQTMTFGQFIDLEVYLSRGIKKHLADIVNILYSCQDSEGMLVRDIWPAVDLWLNWRNDIYMSYKSLFEIEDAVKEEITLEASDSSHDWYSLVMILCDGKFMDIDAATDKPLIQALNFLAWKKDEAKKAERKLQESKKKRVI
jgi:hypothetical protein